MDSAIWRNDPWIELVRFWHGYIFGTIIIVQFQSVHWQAWSNEDKFSTGMKIDFWEPSFRANANCCACQISIRNINAIERFTNFLFFLPFTIYFFPRIFRQFSETWLMNFAKNPVINNPESIIEKLSIWNITKFSMFYGVLIPLWISMEYERV